MTVSGEENYTTAYTYDANNRLLTEVKMESGENSTTTYTYDAAGNRSSLTVTGAENYTTAYTYDANNRLLTEAKTENSATVTTTYTYDANGINTRKETADSITANTYNNFNQLIQVGINGLVATYEYNAQGIRTSKTVGENQTNFLLDGGNVVAEIQGNTTTKTYDYDAFGNERNPDTADSNPFRYCGEYWDQETCTYYLRARYYDPAIGRFTQADTHWNTSNMIYGDNPQKINDREDKLGLKSYSYVPQILSIMQAGNLYVYCCNSPVAFRDISGRNIVQQLFDAAVQLPYADGPYPVGDLLAVVLLATAGLFWLGQRTQDIFVDLFIYLNKAIAKPFGKEDERGALNNRIPENPSIEGHIFQDKSGHLSDTAEHRDLLEGVANDIGCFLGIDKYGNEWYAEELDDGSQIWVEVRNGVIIDGGKNDSPKEWNSETGLKSP